MKHFYPAIFPSDLSLNISNLYVEIGDVITQIDDFLNVLMILLTRMLHIVTHLEEHNAALTKHGLTQAF